MNGSSVFTRIRRDRRSWLDPHTRFVSPPRNVGGDRETGCREELRLERGDAHTCTSGHSRVGSRLLKPARWMPLQPLVHRFLPTSRYTPTRFAYVYAPVLFKPRNQLLHAGKVIRQQVAPLRERRNTIEKQTRVANVNGSDAWHGLRRKWNVILRWTGSYKTDPVQPRVVEFHSIFSELAFYARLTRAVRLERNPV